MYTTRPNGAPLTLAPASALQLADELFEKAGVTVQRAAASLGQTAAAAQQNVERLAQAGILAKETGERNDRVWLCPDIIGIAEADQPPPST